jgi:hypothetical protein
MNNLWLMNSNGCWWTRLWLNLRHYSIFYLERLRKATNILNQYSISPDRNLNQDLPKRRNANHPTMMFGVLMTWPTSTTTVSFYLIDICYLHDQLLSLNSRIPFEMVCIYMCNPVISIAGINSFIFLQEYILCYCGLWQDAVWLVTTDLPDYTVS